MAPEKVKKVECPNCGACLSGRWERLTPGLVKVLVKFKQAVIYKQRNEVSPNGMANLSHSEKCNFQKLRFHGLVAKVRAGGEHLEGLWLLTHRGSQFLLGNLAVPRKVFVFRNQVRDHDQDLATVGQILRSGLPVFDGKFDFEYQKAEGTPQTDFFETVDNKGRTV